MFTGAVDEVWDGGVVDVSDIVSAHTVKLQNGFKTLGASGFCLDGDTDAATNYAESLWDRFTTPRISPLFDGLWAGDQGGVFVDDVEGHSVAMCGGRSSTTPTIAARATSRRAFGTQRSRSSARTAR